MPLKSQPVQHGLDIPDVQIDAIAGAITRGQQDTEADVRESAATALCTAPRRRPAVISAIESGLKSSDSTVVWFVGQQAARMPPDMDAVMPVLLRLLASNDLNDHLTAIILIREFGPAARPYSERIVESVFSSGSDDRNRKMYVLRDTGLTESAARRLVAGIPQLDDDAAATAFISLLDYPSLLQDVYRVRPSVLRALDDQAHHLFRYLCEHQATSDTTRDWLGRLDGISPTTMAMLRDPRFVAVIDSLEKDASTYRKTYLRACKRACGATPSRSIAVDSNHPITFRPESAWPGVDERRRSPDQTGHGDGSTQVLVTGELKTAAGHHPESVRFFRVNDSMLLGEERHALVPILYRATDGRFVFFTDVFAAYSLGAEQPEPGPYQTGSAQIRIEAEGCEPLTVQFFDEMPDVVVTLAPTGS